MTFWNLTMLPNSTKKNIVDPTYADTLNITNCSLIGSEEGNTTLYATVNNQKIALLNMNKKNDNITNLLLIFSSTQEINLSIQGKNGINLIGYTNKKKSTDISSIEDEDEFLAIAFKANKLSKKIDEIYHKRKKQKK